MYIVKRYWGLGSERAPSTRDFQYETYSEAAEGFTRMVTSRLAPFSRDLACEVEIVGPDESVLMKFVNTGRTK